jgi:Ca2+-binding RTX toxin-like protein
VDIRFEDEMSVSRFVGRRSTSLAALASNDTFVGEPGDQTYDGGAGIDTIDYSAATERLYVDLRVGGFQYVGGDFGRDQLLSIENLKAGTGSDKLSGNSSANVIWGGGGDDSLNGGGGADRLFGGAGDDTYIVDSAGDVVREVTTPGIDDGGVDVVKSGATFSLPAFVENLTLTGSAAINGAGNALDNIVYGNDAANRIWGLDGADRLYGYDGSDTLAGGGGDDILTGGGGADTMNGEDGADTYVVDPFDVVRDTGASGIDTVIATSSFSLRTGDGIENIRHSLLGSTSGNLTGNELGNFMVAQRGGNTLMGMAGSDSIWGSSGDDTIQGGAGRDSLVGHSGSDTFVFGAGDSSISAGPTGADTIHEFRSREDHIDLAIFDGSAPSGAYAEIDMNSDAFGLLKGAAETKMTGSVTAVFVAGENSGWLFWSSNGSDGTAEEAVHLPLKTHVGEFHFSDLI